MSYEDTYQNLFADLAISAAGDTIKFENKEFLVHSIEDMDYSQTEYQKSALIEHSPRTVEQLAQSEETMQGWVGEINARFARDNKCEFYVFRANRNVVLVPQLP